MPRSWVPCKYRKGHRCTLYGGSEPTTVDECFFCELRVVDEHPRRPQAWTEIPPSRPEREWLHKLGIPCRG